jgi:hypothetical protein
MRGASLICAMVSMATALCPVSTSAQDFPRIAILESSGGGQFDLLLPALSKQKDLALVDRALLSDAFFERALLEARSGFLEQSNPEAADGLLLIERQADGFELRLFSTHHGLRVWSARVAELTPETTSELARGISGATSKLIPTSNGMMAVGVLAFRPATFSTERLTAARQLARLTEAALEASPGIVTLERRDLGQAGFERSLRRENAEFALSARLLDGSLDYLNGQWQLDLRVRTPGDEADQRAELSAPDLAGLVPQILAKVHGVSPQDKIQAGEAEEFFREAQRLERQKFDSAALQAAETAEALGLREESLTRLLAVLHARRVVPDPRFHGGKYLHQESPTPAEIYHHAMVSLDYCERLDRSKAPLTEVLNACSEFLKVLDKENSDALDIAALRARLRQLAPFDPTAERAPYHLAHAADYASTWADSPEEVIAFHENWLRSNHPKRLWVAKRLRGDPSFTLGEGFPDNEKKQRLVRELIARIKADPHLELTGLMLEFSIGDPQASPKALRSYYKKFAAQAAELEMRGEFESLVDLEMNDTGKLAPFAAERALRLVRVLPVLTQLHNQFLYQEFQAEFAPDDARKVWAAFAEYRDRLLAEADKPNETKRLLAHLGTIFLQRNPQAASVLAQDPEAIFVRRFWIMPGGTPERGRYTTRATAVGDGIWLSAGWRTANRDSQFWFVKTPSLAAECIEVPGRVATAQFVVTEQAIFGVYGEYPGNDRPMEYEIGRGDLKSRAWEFRPIRPVCQIFTLGGDDLAFNLWTPGGREEENGVLLYDWPTGREDLLASSVRHPHKTPLDAVANARVDAVRKLPNGRLLVTQGAKNWQVLSVEPKDGSFDVLLQGPKLEAFPEADGLLLAGQLGDVWHFNGETLSCWIGDTGRWPEPDSFSHDIVSEHRIASHDERLFFLSREANGSFRLHILADGLPSAGIHFPLHFDSSVLPDPATDVFGLKLFATNTGLVILPLGHGLWFLPYTDIPGFEGGSSAL